MEISFYINVASLALFLLSAILLLCTRPDLVKTKYLEEIAPDAKYDVRLQKVLLVASATLGLAISILLPLVGTSSPQDSSQDVRISYTINILVWAYVSVLTLLIVIATRHNVIFCLVCHLTAVGLVKFAYSVMSTADTIYYLMGHNTVSMILGDLDVILAIVSTLASLCLFVTGLNVPRAPRMEYNDKAVVSLAYSTLFQQATFSYSERVQAVSRKNATLTLQDLDSMPFDFRASTLIKRFSVTRGQYSLPRRLWIALKGPLTLQWTLAVISGIMLYAPAFFLLKILNFFEIYKSSAESGHVVSIYTGLGWVFGLFIVKLAASVVGSQLWWISAAVLQVNARAAASSS